MRVGRDVAQRIVAIRVRGVGAQPKPVRLDRRPAFREPAGLVAVRPVRDVALLPDVQGVLIVLAVARVVAHGLHAELPGPQSFRR